MPDVPSYCDVLIAGGGLAGLSLAAALKSDMGDGIEIAVCDPSFGRRPKTTRASAIAAGPRRMLDALGIWPKVAAKAQPIYDMVITDSRLEDPVRPVFLTFSGDIEPGEPFAHMVYNADLIEALDSALRAEGVHMLAARVECFQAGRDDVTVKLAGGETMIARLIIAADGGRSRLREAAGIAMVGWDYRQAGIVATIGHEKDHLGRAEEHFLPSGPFAILPMPGRASSIVWTERVRVAERLVALDAAAFLAEVEQRFGQGLGELTLLDRPQSFPLGLYMARHFVGERLALVGDAAHIIHPIAGQGLNLGLRDAAVLAECLVESLRLGLDPGSAGVLRRYEQARRFDTATMAVATDGLNRLFSNDSMPLRLARDLGLGLVDRLAPLKHLFVREAAGFAGAAPARMRSERRRGGHS